MKVVWASEIKPPNHLALNPPSHLAFSKESNGKESLLG